MAHVSIHDANFVTKQEIKAIIKRKYLLKSLLTCIDFNVTLKKDFGADNPEPSRKTGDILPLNFSKSVTVFNYFSYVTSLFG